MWPDARQSLGGTGQGLLAFVELCATGMTHGCAPSGPCSHMLSIPMMDRSHSLTTNITVVMGPGWVEAEEVQAWSACGCRFGS